jgi:hypothetical protein
MAILDKYSEKLKCLLLDLEGLNQYDLSCHCEIETPFLHFGENKVSILNIEQQFYPMHYKSEAIYYNAEGKNYISGSPIVQPTNFKKEWKAECVMRNECNMRVTDIYFNPDNGNCSLLYIKIKVV